MDRRNFLKTLTAASIATAAVATGCKREEKPTDIAEVALGEVPTDKMTYRTNPSTGDKVSLLGFGAMRFPTIYGGSARGTDDKISQKKVNDLVDYAIAHGVNYFDTAPVYCKGFSESAMGEALSHHDRSKFYIATKLSNFDPSTWSRKASMQIYENSFRYLKTDYIDYLLLHSVGQPDDVNTALERFNKRFVDNGMLDFLMDERRKGRIRNLGFSYHGNMELFEYLLSMHEVVQWDFVQIQMNYIDWRHAEDGGGRNANAEKLYSRLDELGIPVVIMEPLLGGQLASLNEHLTKELKTLRPQSSIASWAFRFAGSFPRILTVLSGMTYMEHLQDNIRTYSPLEPCTEEELALLEHVAGIYLNYPLVPCTSCRYCMPCPYGIDIPGVFSFYNKMVNSGNVTSSAADPEYNKSRCAFLIGYDRALPGIRQADHCIGCNQCSGQCPQRIDIPAKMRLIDEYVEKLKQNNL